PGTGPLNNWIKPALNRFEAKFGIIHVDLNYLIIEKCMTLSEILKTIKSLIELEAFLFLTHIWKNNENHSRNYGQCDKDFIYEVLRQEFKFFQVLTENENTDLIHLKC
ncbi:hypothetical protein, partial [Leptospira ognonensis]|uniref:hypothetical protein n=1 Tax=Leptospira ognonensis TaxID=2484945 RepID=UPI001AEF7EBB